MEPIDSLIVLHQLGDRACFRVHSKVRSEFVTEVQTYSYRPTPSFVQII